VAAVCDKRHCKTTLIASLASQQASAFTTAHTHISQHCTMVHRFQQYSNLFTDGEAQIHGSNQQSSWTQSACATVDEAAATASSLLCTPALHQQLNVAPWQQSCVSAHNLLQLRCTQSRLAVNGSQGVLHFLSRPGSFLMMVPCKHMKYRYSNRTDT
jgi:hypothetical protein